MKKSLLLSLALLFTPFLLRAAEFSSAQGSVEIKKSGAAVWLHAKPKTPVATGDVIRTGAGSAAEVNLDEGHKVSLREKTTARVESAKKGDSRFFLEMGRLKARVSKLKGGSKFEVRTPLAVASVRGTVFEVEVGQDQSSRLFVTEGRVSYKELAAAGREVMVPAGEAFTFRPPAPKDGRPGAGPAQPNQPDQKTAPTGDGATPPADEPQKSDAGGDGAVVKVASLTPLRTSLLTTDLKQDILRETTLSIDKDVIQTDAIQQVKQEQIQDGKALVDRLGRRVRYEEFLTRPDDKSYSQTFLSERDGRTDTARWTVYAANTLPKDLRTADLFRSPDNGALKNWATGTEWLVSNGDTYYREWRDGGNPMDFSSLDPKTGGQINWQQTIFKNWFVEAKGTGQDPVLLTHWVPAASLINPNTGAGDPNATAQRDEMDLFGYDTVKGGVVPGQGDGGQDIPSGYMDYDSDGKGVIGDVRPIDKTAWDPATRELYFSNSKVADAYDRSEGYSRTTVAMSDDKSLSGVFSATTLAGRQAELGKIMSSSSKLSLVSTYQDPSTGKKFGTRVDGYYVTDDGVVVPYGKVGSVLTGFTGVNREWVYTSSLDKADIDVMVSPTSLRPDETGEEDAPSSTVAQPLP